MAKVLIYKLDNDGSQKIICTCELVGNSVELEGDDKLVSYLKAEGISDYHAKSPGKLFPKDGINFLKNLRFNFDSGYFNATDIVD